MEKILRIEEVDGYKPSKDDWNSFEGYRVVTDKQDIYVLVSDRQSCCESAGYLSTNDDVNDFIGAELLSVVKVDLALKPEKIDLMFEYGFDGGGIIFINLETSKGTLQLAVYNSHNGYYGHQVKIISKQLTVEEYV